MSNRKIVHQGLNSHTAQLAHWLKLSERRKAEEYARKAKAQKALRRYIASLCARR